ncbi:uncharacterized protein [Ptychodera flava]|uniref:uncharacterized protein isoform X2 n=1 Tax=Ptychodera flava TaxID=63121 RepID=UPI00396A7904
MLKLTIACEDNIDNIDDFVIGRLRLDSRSAQGMVFTISLTTDNDEDEDTTTTEPALSTKIIITMAVWGAVITTIIVFLSIYVSCVKRRRPKESGSETQVDDTRHESIDGFVPRVSNPYRDIIPQQTLSEAWQQSEDDVAHLNPQQSTQMGIDNPTMTSDAIYDRHLPDLQNQDLFHGETDYADATTTSYQEYQ